MADDSNQISLATLRLRGARRVRQPSQITALDIDGALLRVAAGSRRGARAEFSQVAVAPLQFAPNADREDAVVLGKAIATALESLRISPGSVAMAIPRGRVILRNITLPALDDVRELAAMVRLQVGKELPYRKEDAIIDFEVRPQPAAAPAVPDPSSAGTDTQPTAKLDALVAVAQRDVVEFYRNVCSAAGLKLAALTLLPFAHAQALIASGAVEGEETVAFVVIRNEDVSVDVIRAGKLLFSRDATLAEEHHHDEAAETAPVAAPESDAPIPNGKLTPVERITIEIVRSLHAFSGTMLTQTVSKVLVTGGTGHEGAVLEVLSKRVAVPVALFDTAAALGVTDREAGAGAASVAGTATAATDPAGLSFDFLEPKQPAVQRDMKRIRILAAAAVLVLLVSAVAGLRFYFVKQRERVLQQVNAEAANIQKHQTLYRRTRAQAAGIQSWLAEEKDWLQHYAYLSAVLPRSEEIYITSLGIGAQGNIRLAVQARSGEVLAKLDKQLRDAGYEVKPQAITPGTDRYGYNFKSSVELIVPPKMKIDLSKVQPPARPADDVSLNPPGKRTAASNARPFRETLAGNGGAR